LISDHAIGIFAESISGLNGNGCKLWLGSIAKNGYGYFYADKKTYKAHRFSYELANGSIPKSKLILHKCKQQRDCVNPDHLYAGTHSDNVRDSIKDGTHKNQNMFKTNCGTCGGYIRLCDANTYVYPKGWRDCRSCNRKSVKEYQAKRRNKK